MLTGNLSSPRHVGRESPDSARSCLEGHKESDVVRTGGETHRRGIRTCRGDVLVLTQRSAVAGGVRPVNPEPAVVTPLSEWKKAKRRSFAFVVVRLLLVPLVPVPVFGVAVTSKGDEVSSPE